MGQQSLLGPKVFLDPRLTAAGEQSVPGQLLATLGFPDMGQLPACQIGYVERDYFVCHMYRGASGPTLKIKSRMLTWGEKGPLIWG